MCQCSEALEVKRIEHVHFDIIEDIPLSAYCEELELVEVSILV